jgi:pyruvate,water dikinase
VEKFYGQPMDIEWGWAKGTFALLQSRPIRGLEVLRDVEEGRREEITRLKQLAGGKRKVWIRHNLHEILPHPTPLTWDIVRDFMKGSGGFGKMYVDFGYKPSKTVCEEGFLELICGVIYADPERTAELFWGQIPLQYNIQELSRNPKLMDSAPTELVPERVDGKVLKALPRFVRDMIRCSRTMKKWRQYVVERFDNEIVPVFVEWVKKKHEQDLTKLSTSEVLDELNERIELGLNKIGAESLKPGFFGGMAQANLEATLCRIMGDTKGRQLAMVLTQGLEGDTTVEQNMMLYRLAKGEVSKKEFMEKFGHRAIGEMELSRPRWREDDTYIRQVVESMLGSNVPSPEELHTVNMERRLEAERKLPEILSEWGGNCFLEEIIKEMRDAQKMLPYREIGKNYLMMGYETIRMAIMELSRRWNLGRDIFFLHFSELPLYEKNPSEFAPKIQARKIRWQAFKRLEMPDVIDTDDLENLGLPRKYEHAMELKGDAVASGVATGPAQIIFDPQEAAPGCVDYILVCPSTDPSWTALFVHAKGLVVEQGGMLSHGAIVARDFGIPAVVCPGATKRIPKGAMIRVDGNRGLITILEGTGKG